MIQPDLADARLEIGTGIETLICVEIGVAMKHFGFSPQLPFDHSQATVQLFHQRASCLDPVTIIQIENTVDLAHGGMVNVTAENCIKAVFKSVLGDRLFKITVMS